MLNSELSTFNTVKPEINSTVYAPHLPGLQVSAEIQVECTTLESLLEDEGIKRVDFIKIDTQGNDLEVFLSAGTFLEVISAAVLEFPYTDESAIYEKEINLVSALAELAKVNFYPVRIVPNGGGECNVFVRNGNFDIESYFSLEKFLDFENAPTLKIGKHDPYINMSVPRRITLKLKVWIKETLFDR
jgi:hypothetical protein